MTWLRGQRSEKKKFKVWCSVNSRFFLECEASHRLACYNGHSEDRNSHSEDSAPCSLYWLEVHRNSLRIPSCPSDRICKINHRFGAVVLERLRTHLLVYKLLVVRTSSRLLKEPVLIFKAVIFLMWLPTGTHYPVWPVAASPTRSEERAITWLDQDLHLREVRRPMNKAIANGFYRSLAYHSETWVFMFSPNWFSRLQ